MGQKATIGSVIVFYGFSAALSIYLGLAYMIVLAVGIFNSAFYSLPPLRFNAHPLSILISFSVAVVLAFLAVTIVTVHVNLLNPVLWLVTYFIFIYAMF